MAVKKINAGVDFVQETSKPRKKFTPEEIEIMRQKDNELVYGVFKYHECKGGTLRFMANFYKNDKPKIYTLVDNERYHLPLIVARHLNNDVAIKLYEPVKNVGLGNLSSGIDSTMKVKQVIHKTGFYSLDFKDVGENNQTSLLTVERA